MVYPAGPASLRPVLLALILQPPARAPPFSGVLLSPRGAFDVALVPHTLAVTTLGGVRPGDRLHFEADVLAKYVERALAVQRAPSSPQGERR